jgi:hypothetical protein
MKTFEKMSDSAMESDMQYRPPKYTSEDVERAGEDYIKNGQWGNENGLAIVNDWRASHLYPMQALYLGLKRHAAAFPPRSRQVAQRIKRLPSIEKKLQRFSGRSRPLSLSEMQDIGGCRVILSDIGQLRQFLDRLEVARWKHKLVKENDYIAKPKLDGYRSLHRVYEFHADGPGTVYDGRKIEIQIRTELQHLWATAVETVDTFTGQDIKLGGGERNWKRFFVLVSSLFAIREGQPIVPDSIQQIRKELEALCKEHDFITTLSGYAISANLIDKKRISVSPKYFLITLDYEMRRLSIQGYQTKRAAINNYSIAESSASSTLNENIVLVSTSLVSKKSIDALKRAYPNYFLNARKFLRAVGVELAKKS